MRYVILEGRVSSNVTFCYDRGGGGRKIPISALRNLWTAPIRSNLIRKESLNMGIRLVICSRKKVS